MVTTMALVEDGTFRSAEQYQISVFVDVTCYNQEEKTTLWEENRLRGYGIYSADELREEARTKGLGDAFRILTKDIVDRTQVGGW